MCSVVHFRLRKTELRLGTDWFWLNIEKANMPHLVLQVSIDFINVEQRAQPFPNFNQML